MSNLQTKIELSLRIEGLCYKPQLHVANSKLHTIAAYIEGLASADDENFEEMQAFSKWLAIKLKFPINSVWWDILGQRYTDEEALTHLPLLFKEFKQSQG